MKRRSFGVVLGLALLAALVVGQTVAAKEYTLRWAHSYQPEHPFHVAAEMVAKDVAEKTGGNVKINVYPAGQLGSEKDIVEGLAMGTLDMVIAGPGELGKWHKPILVMEAAYVFRDVDHMYKVVRGEVGQELWGGLLEETGMRVLDTWYYGTRHVTSNKPVYTPNDMKGMKLRAPDMPMSIANTKAMGASPTPMALSEVYLALQQGAVDGQENPIATIAANRFYEVQSYLNMTGHVVQATPVAINEMAFQNLPGEYQDVLVSSIAKHTDIVRGMIADYEAEWLDKFQEFGMKIVESDIDAFMAATKVIPQEFGSQWGEGLYERIQQVQ